MGTNTGLFCLAPGIIPASFSALLLLLLSQHLGTTEGGTCPQRAEYVPDQTLGVPWETTYNDTLRDSTETITIAVGRPDEFQAECCSSGRIMNWTITPTREYQYVGRINATCTDGEMISTPLFGYNGTKGIKNDTEFVPWICTNDETDTPQTLYQPDNEGVFPYETNVWMTMFMGVGNPDKAYLRGAFSCPAGTRAIGIGARSSCYALVGMQVVCATTNDTQDNLGALNTEPQCSADTSRAGGVSLVDPSAWSYTRDKDRMMFSGAANETETQCCPNGAAVANWTIAVAPNPNDTVGNYTGLIQGRCTDGTVLAAVKYGFNGTGSPVCNQQRLTRVYNYNTPLSQQFFYSTTSTNDNGVDNLLTSFMSPPDVKVEERLQLTCPSGQAAVGYSAASSCYSLANVSIICGNVSDAAKLELQTFGSSASNPPTDAEAGDLCPSLGGVTMVPDDSYSDTANGLPIGKISAWTIQAIPNSPVASPLKTQPMSTATASPLSASCCPSGQVIKAFNVWPSANINYLVGKVSAVCSAYSNGKDPTTTSEIAYGFNGTSLDGTPTLCSDSLHEMRSVPLNANGSWSYRSSWNFESLMEWPVRNATNAYGTVAPMSTLSCPAGQQPIAFAARRTCWALADFRVICGVVNVKQVGPGLSPGAKAGIAVGVIAAVALVALLAGYIFYRRYQIKKSKTRIASRQLFNLNGPAGFYTGTVSPDQDFRNSKDSFQSSTDSRSSTLKLMSTGLMTIENIDDSNDSTPTSFEGIPPEWEIKANQLKLHCVDGKPIELGRGGFGVVLFGTVHKENAAIKMIKGRSNENELLKEIAILERAKTKYVVRFLGYSVCPDGILLAMEYMQGGTLWHALRDSEEFQWYNRGQQAFKDICYGLYMLHMNRIAHLDMKTPNVLIGDDYTCKISDLGLGKLMKGEANTATADSMGSFAWMGPEQIQGRCGLASDIWALSTIIWEICTLGVPSREALPTDIRVPEEAPQEVVDLMAACRREDPKSRPHISDICDLLDSWDGATPATVGHVSVEI